MTHGSLFSGIGGFDLAAQWMGWENAFHCEINPFGRQVLNYYWPNATSYEDITKTDFTIHRGRIDVLTGGFPCQPFSLAGKRKGTEDDRHLWPEMCRAIREIEPRWIVGENVFGLVNWDGGLVFEQVQADLEAEGYEVQPYILPAAGVGAPHKRDRVWFVAHTLNRDAGGASGQYARPGGKERIQERNEVQQSCESGGVWDVTDANLVSEHFKPVGRGNDEAVETFGQEQETGQSDRRTHPFRAASNSDSQHGREQHKQSSSDGTGPREESCWGRINHAAHTGDKGFQRRKVDGSTESCRQERHKQPTGRVCPDWDEFPTQPPVRGRNDGVPAGLAGITVSKHRNESIKAYGNAIVPQVVLEIFKAIEQWEHSSF